MNRDELLAIRGRAAIPLSEGFAQTEQPAEYCSHE